MRQAFSFGAEGGSSGSGGASGPDQQAEAAWEAASSLSAQATEMAEGGDLDGAKRVLRGQLPELVDKYGADDPSVGLIHNQLSLWDFFDGASEPAEAPSQQAAPASRTDYGEAVDQARAAHQVWAKQAGEDSPAAAFHGIRLGMALAADGRPEEAFPLLEQGLTVAVDNFNQHLSKLEQLQPLAEDGEAAAEGASAADDEAMAARAQQQHVSLVMLDNLGRALQEAKFYRALSFLGVSGREMDATWDDKGAGAAFFLQQEMSDAVTDMLRWVMPNHPTVQLVAQCEKVGLRRLHDDLQIHGQRLQDLVHEATSSKDG
ncbi:hypothetical protein CHLNCDRAFT_140880 [Chlorella variabilis]|uniref:Uncharacterized protein n=1 Tax=Chlorella variabilis TaxID=554065 RepID=E1Z6F3_CHLVA|nr:hypothetical protein CHLNCDRAFT_140880 [Chlorella variabilis]EFN58638.1 hypothetical protein CHLNCDRAFT_140880 [Chlorella variabilis]|eukprot:XP_005850740.1 hypothetical protein CHLNCDRAFT_140880 [Chlorella variabilis]